MTRLDILARAVAAVMVTGFFGGAAAQDVKSRDERRTLTVGGQDRAYFLNRHKLDALTGKAPILIYLHGIGALASEELSHRYDIPFTELPDLEPILILRPQGMNREWDTISRAIDASRRPSGFDGRDADDLGFFRSMIDEMVERERGDPDRVYFVGISNGGFMTARVACEMSDRVAAVANIIATARASQLNNCREGRPVPLLLMASTTDPTNPYAGRPGDAIFALASAPETAAFFAARNKCRSRAESVFPHLDPKLNSTVSLIRFAECEQGAEVLFYRIDGSGHTVPSLKSRDGREWRLAGSPNRDIEASVEVWSFLKKYRRSTN